MTGLPPAIEAALGLLCFAIGVGVMRPVSRGRTLVTKHPRASPCCFAPCP